MRRNAEPEFATEAALCAAFMEWARPQGWTPYPETAGFDIVLAHGDGTQIGIQAKLRFTLALLQQIVPSDTYGHERGPDFYAVLIPNGGSHEICSALGVGLLQYSAYGGFHPTIERGSSWYHGWHFWNPAKRCELPRFVPDVVAGASGPTQLTKWKIAAMGVAAVLELRGFVTRDDFKFYGIDNRRWMTGGWLVASDVPGRFVKGLDWPGFESGHPVVYPKVRDEVRARLASIAGIE